MTNNTNFDCIIVGSGPAGMQLASTLTRNNKDVLLIEKDKFGGVCPHRGCFPKKMLAARASKTLSLRDESRFLTNDDVKLSYSDLSRFVQKKLEGLGESKKNALTEKGITCLKGEATFNEQMGLIVDGEEFNAPHIVIATGSSPRKFTIPGGDSIVLSDDFFSLESLPTEIVFIGGGYISLEFACIALASGCNVTVIDHGSRILKNFDERLTSLLTRDLKRRGMNFIFNKEVGEVIDNAGDGFDLHFDNDERMHADLVVGAIGRTPNISSLNLSNLGLKISEPAHLPSKTTYELTMSDTSLHFIGDVIDNHGLPFTPRAHKEAEELAGIILTDSDFLTIPAMSPTSRSVFTYPELATVTKDDISELDYQTVFIEGPNLSSYYSTTCAAAILKYIPEEKQLAGVELLGPNVSEMMGKFALIIDSELGASAVFNELECFPSVSSSFEGTLRKHLIRLLQ